MRLLVTFFLSIFMALILAGCLSPSWQQEAPTKTVLVIPPTWTPTPVAKRAADAVPHATPGSTLRPPPLPTYTPPIAPSPNDDLPPTVIPSARVDAAGPLAIATVQPLTPGQGRNPVRLMIPVLNMDVPVSPMGWHMVQDPSGAHSEWDVPDFSAGHHIDSAFPGEAGNVVLSGHNNLGARVFGPISTIGEPGNPLGLGDEMIIVDEIGRRFTYRVTGWKRFPENSAYLDVRRENASYLQQTDFPQITLITCWPPQSNTHRVIIFGALTQRAP